MTYHYPTPQDVGLSIPSHLMKECFKRGFLHALKGKQITTPPQLRLSYREGYRAGKLYLQYLRRARGVISFPLQGKIKFKAAA